MTRDDAIDARARALLAAQGSIRVTVGKADNGSPAPTRNMTDAELSAFIAERAALKSQSVTSSAPAPEDKPNE